MNSKQQSDLKSMINQGWVNIYFTKKDGSLRKLIGTTKLELIPIEKHPKKKEVTVEEVDSTFEVEKVEDPDPVITVFEKDNSWRSFRISQLVSMESHIEGNV